MNIIRVTQDEANRKDFNDWLDLALQLWTDCAIYEIAVPNSTDGVSLWAKYLISWTFWNHVRTVAPLAAVLFLIALSKL